MRIIVHTGKGGVGKTSISAATALRCAELGQKTIVISTDTRTASLIRWVSPIGPERFRFKKTCGRKKLTPVIQLKNTGANFRNTSCPW